MLQVKKQLILKQHFIFIAECCSFYD